MKRKMAAFLAAVVAVWFGEIIQAGAQVPDTMVLIPAGSFQMGDVFNDGGRVFPVHTLYIDAYYMDKYEVTGKLWDEVCQWATNHGYNFTGYAEAKNPNHPVHSVNWFNAIKWCNARSEKEGKVPAYYTNTVQVGVYRAGQTDIQNDLVKWNGGYRLPTEAEWEKAARGGLSGKRFPWGDTISHSQANYYSMVDDSYDISPTRGYYPAFNDGVFPYTSPVGSFAPNGYGLYDISGNVWEWCWDYYYTNPVGPDIKYRAIHGGHWQTDASKCRIASRIGSYNPSFYTGFRCVLPAMAEWRQVIEAQPVQPTYSEPPKKADAKDSLVVVTHGWQPAWKPVDIAWMDAMTNTISKYLLNQGLTEWQVHAHKWVEKAQAPLPFGPEITLYNAEQEGENLGNSIAAKEWKHVHLIAHSAGAPLIEKIAEKIKEKWKNTTVHLTFLDPYVGAVYDGRNKYGNRADWADNYFTRDLETSGEIFTLTEGTLKHAFNVDVTFLDKSKTKGNVYRSSSGSVIQQCQEATTTHGWPYEFYIQTIPPNAITGSDGFGFSVSKEGGNWDFAKSQYKTGNATQVLGIPDPSCLPSLYETTPAYIGQMNFFTTPSVSSTTGIVQKNDFGVTLVSVVLQGLKTQSLTSRGLATPAPSAGPVWLVSTITITNAVNLLSFQTAFSSSAGAEGLLSVYWETNVIGTIDERVASSGIRQYTFPVPKVMNGTQTLGFRLDSFSSIASSVTVTNVALGFAGVREPFSLSLVGSQPDGLPILQLTGQKDFNYTVETSANLVDWKVFAILVNTKGVVRFNTTSDNATARFYRAVAP